MSRKWAGGDKLTDAFTYDERLRVAAGDERPEHDWRPWPGHGVRLLCARCGLDSFRLSLRNVMCLLDREVGARRAMRKMDKLR